MNKKKYTISIYLTGFLGYYIGTVGYTLIGGDNKVIYQLSGFLMASLIGFIYYLYSKKRYSKVLKEITMEQKDERGQIIAGKSSMYTLLLTVILSISIFIFSVIKDYDLIAIVIGVLYIIALIFYLVIHSYLEKNY